MKNSNEEIEMNDLCDRIPGVSWNYKEFQEPLVEFEN